MPQNGYMITNDQLPEFIEHIAALSDRTPTPMRIKQSLFLLCGVYSPLIQKVYPNQGHPEKLYDLNVKVGKQNIISPEIDDICIKLKLQQKFETDTLKKSNHFITIDPFLQTVIKQLNDMGDFQLVEIMHTTPAWKKAYNNNTDLDMDEVYNDFCKYLTPSPNEPGGLTANE